jgi:hypothetical protein
MRALLFLIIFLISTISVFAQLEFNGIVSDQSTKKPLAFVSVSISNAPTLATMSDIDGKFKIKLPQVPCQIAVSYIGYAAQTIEIKEIKTELYSIFLAANDFGLREIEIIAGENPAHRIIKKVWINRNKHNPGQLPSYRCDIYNKLLLTGKPDSAFNPKLISELERKKSFDTLFEAQHLFLMESFNKRISRNGNAKEKVVGSKISGIKEASFFMMALKYQPFSLYEPKLDISGKTYLNPISKNSEDLYSFSLLDTIFNGNDSIYVISFKPKKQKTFDAIEGTLYISAPDYALQNVQASPANNDGTIAIRLQQQYKRLPNGQWFIEQINTDLNFLTVKLPGYKLIGESRTYIENVAFEPEVKRNEIDEYVLDVESESGNKNELFWEEVRIDQLSEREQRTYRMLDSLSKAENLNFKLKALESIVKGYIPIRWFDLDINRVFAYNLFEGFRLGAGGLTNNRLSKHFSIGGHFGYGFKDYQWKYGAEGHWLIQSKNDVQFNLSYSYDVNEAGGTHVNNDRRQQRAELVRKLIVRNMDFEEITESSFGFRMLRYINTDIFTRQRHVAPQYQYSFLNLPAHTRFSWLETGVAIKIAWKEQFYRNGNLRISLGSKFPVLRVQLTHGNDLSQNGKLNYNRVDIRLEEFKKWRRIGTSFFNINGGVIDGLVPYARLFNGRGNFKGGKASLRLAGENNFETMQMNEFLSDRYFAIFFRHNLGSFFKIEDFKPEFVVANNVLFGTLKNPNYHQFIDFKIPNKGFYEAGIQINNLINFSTGGYGISAFYRYGPYSSPIFKNNIAIKLTLSLLMQ